MKKSERLHQMLRFINQKQHFTLKDLMQEFQISKRTALRDVESLEEMGAPIYVEYGRYGGYRLLNEVQLPPISFNSQEVYALYFAIQALRSFSNLPFQASFQSIHEKFMDKVSDRQKEDIEKMQNKVSFQHTVQIRDSRYLDVLLLASIENQVLRITYQRGKQVSKRDIQPIRIRFKKGFWYCQAYDMTKEAYRVFRCDRIQTAESTNLKPTKLLNEDTIHDPQELWTPSQKAVSFKCLITDHGIERAQLESFPSIKIKHELGKTYLLGWYEPHELDFIVSYFASFGKSLQVIEPIQLKEKLKKYYQALIDHIE
ncbi:WYL domain-containing protein [Seinonella peptonophila]|uniref:WYL domain-containing protein n=1 Tax=Seinonella peptonophila TaxID=112248 RepID=UPI000934E89B